MTVWLDGRLVEASAARVSAFDHGITVGDGVFETLKVRDGVPFALTRHLERLAFSAAGLGLSMPAAATLREAVAQTLVAARSSAESSAESSAGSSQGASPGVSPGLRLRITLTGGPGPLGSERGDVGPTLLLATAPLSLWPETSKVVVVPWTRNERSATAGLKTTSYAENVVALAHAKSLGASEALLANTKGLICEGTGSNIFVVTAGRVLTPPLQSGCLAGVTRALVIEWGTGEDDGYDVIEQDVTAADLRSADEVFLTSSTRDVQGVSAVGDDVYGAPGPVTRLVARTFAARSAADLDP